MTLNVPGAASSAQARGGHQASMTLNTRGAAQARGGNQGSMGARSSELDEDTDGVQEVNRHRNFKRSNR